MDRYYCTILNCIQDDNSSVLTTSVFLFLSLDFGEFGLAPAFNRCLQIFVCPFLAAIYNGDCFFLFLKTKGQKKFSNIFSNQQKATVFWKIDWYYTDIYTSQTKQIFQRLACSFNELDKTGSIGIRGFTDLFIVPWNKKLLTVVKWMLHFWWASWLSFHGPESKRYVTPCFHPHHQFQAPYGHT